MIYVRRSLRTAAEPWPWGMLCATFAISDLLLTRPSLLVGWAWVGQWLFTHLVVVVALPLYARTLPTVARKLAIFGTAFFCAQAMSHALWLIAAMR